MLILGSNNLSFHDDATTCHHLIFTGSILFSRFSFIHSFILDGYILLPFFELLLMLLILQLSIIQFTKTIHLNSLLTVMGIQGIMYESDIKNSITRRSTFEYFFAPLCLDVFSVLTDSCCCIFIYIKRPIKTSSHLGMDKRQWYSLAKLNGNKIGSFIVARRDYLQSC